MYADTKNRVGVGACTPLAYECDFFSRSAPGRTERFGMIFPI